MDVRYAFLYGYLDMVVYMTPPLGLNAPPEMVCKLLKSLYGLREAPRKWFSKLAAALRAFGFQQSYDDFSLLAFDHLTP